MFHVGFGLGLIGMNEALAAIRWDPPRYTTTAFEFAYTNEWWMQQLAGWIGLDSFDERNPVGKEFLDRFRGALRGTSRVLHAGVLLRHGAGDRARNRRCGAAHRPWGQGRARAHQDAARRVGRARDVPSVRSVHPAGLGRRRVPRRPTRAARRESYGVPRDHPRHARPARSCCRDAGRAVGHRCGRCRPAPGGRRRSRARARRALRLQPRQGRCRRRSARRT